MPTYTNIVGNATGGLNVVTQTSGGSVDPLGLRISTRSRGTPDELRRQYEQWNARIQEQERANSARIASKQHFIDRFGKGTPVRWYADWERDYPDGGPTVPEHLLHNGEGDLMPTTEENIRALNEENLAKATQARDLCHQAVKFIVRQRKEQNAEQLIKFLTDTNRLPSNSWGDVRRAYGPWADDFLSKARSNSESGHAFLSRFLDAADKYLEGVSRELQPN